MATVLNAKSYVCTRLHEHTKSDIQALMVEENKTAREILRAPMRTFTEYVKREANIGDMRQSIMLQKILLVQHLLKRKGKLGELIRERWASNNDHFVWIQGVQEYMRIMGLTIKDLDELDKLALKRE